MVFVMLTGYRFVSTKSAGGSGNRFTPAELLVSWDTFSVIYLSTTTFPRECTLVFVLGLKWTLAVYSDRSAPSDAPRNVKANAVYSPLHMALRHQWSALTRRQTKELNPAGLHAILGGLNWASFPPQFDV